MKKRYAGILCILLLCMTAILSGVTVSASSAADNSSFPANDLLDADLASYFQQYPWDNEFGGVYRDGDTLIVNYVGEYNELVIPRSMMDTNEKIEYHSVQYSLRELEEVKDYLSSMMLEYGIKLLDANEATNLVDVELNRLTEETVEAITALVEKNFGCSDCLNFVDLGGATIEATVAYERPQY